MCKFTNVDDLPKELHDKFRLERGALAAFCREKQVSSEWMRLIFTGRYEADDLLIEATEFLALYKANKQAEKIEKQRLLAEKIADLSP